MTIDYSKLRSLTARKLISALIKDGFILDRIRGAHHQYIHPEKGRVTVSFHHLSDTFPPKTLRCRMDKGGPKKARAFKIDQRSNSGISNNIIAVRHRSRELSMNLRFTTVDENRVLFSE